MTRAREQIISLSDTPYYHCMARCVRRAFLFGEDSVTGRSFDHRKAWVVDKLAFLSDVFAIDVCAYAVMSNHYHVVLRVDIEAAETWSMDEVIERWISLFAGNALVARYVAGGLSSQAELNRVAEFADQWRERLGDISWFMRVLNESIARMANEEDECRGRFWEGRFKSQALLDEAAVLACMAYVDLNPIRAGVAELPENSDFTSIQDRIAELATRGVGRPRNRAKVKDKAKEPAAQNYDKKPTLFAFNQGHDLQEGEKALPFSLEDYMTLMDWTGRAIRQDKRGSIPETAPPILSRLGLSIENWLKFVPAVEQNFTHAIGHREKLIQFAQKFDVAWLRGQKMAATVYP